MENNGREQLGEPCFGLATICSKLLTGNSETTNSIFDLCFLSNIDETGSCNRLLLRGICFFGRFLHGIVCSKKETGQIHDIRKSNDSLLGELISSHKEESLFFEPFLCRL